eukprot:14715702-Alexandrium_andersonii.AAC.1
MKESSSWSFFGRATAPPRPPPGWRSRREQPPWEGYRPRGPPDWRLQRAGCASWGGPVAPEAPAGGVRGG